MPPGPTALAAAVIGACLLAPAAAAQERERPTWREVLQRFEGRLDEALDRVARVDESAAPLVGIYFPPGPAPDDAAALPNLWRPLAERADVPRRLVLLVHGLDEPGDIWVDLAPALVEAGHDVARFEYPNDQRVHASAAQLLESLRRARAAGVEEVVLIGHSMGGLVSFDALTREDGYAGLVAGGDTLPRVERLIAVGVPWEGSPWASLRAAAEVREQVQRWFMDKSWSLAPLLDYRRDGRGQAGDDLAPGSALITELRARPMPEGLALTTLAGRIAAAEPPDLAWLRESKLARRMVGDEQLDELVERLQRPGRMVGDGAVPLESALARAGEDAAVFEVNHRALIRRSPVDFLTGTVGDRPPGIDVILARLAQARERGEDAAADETARDE